MAIAGFVNSGAAAKAQRKVRAGGFGTGQFPTSGLLRQMLSWQVRSDND